MLGGHDTVVLVPDDLDIAPLRELDADVEIRRTPNECWGSVANHERMLMSSRFYEWFGDHTHVLVYHLDAFVFRDELFDWCVAGYDYVACPWFEGFKSASADAPMVGVGNGGFSLRRVETFLRLTRVLEQPATWRTRLPRALPVRVRAALRKVVMPAARFVRVPDRVLERLFMFCSRGTKLPEDMFWGLRAGRALRSFSVAPLDAGMAFAFEMQPSRLYAMRGGRLPFGCHAWATYEPEFWRPHIDAAQPPAASTML